SQIIPSVQASAISSDFSNCGSSKLILASREEEQFVAQNFDSITKEMALGRGENLMLLSSMFGCQGKNLEFAAYAQENYESLLASENITYSEMLVALKKGLASDPVLAASCQAI
ncbi:MAG: DUF3015 family protein, partial [bacterium]